MVPVTTNQTFFMFINFLCYLLYFSVHLLPKNMSGFSPNKNPHHRWNLGWLQALPTCQPRAPCTALQPLPGHKRLPSLARQAAWRRDQVMNLLPLKSLKYIFNTKPSLDTLDVSRSRSVLELFFVGFQSLDAILDGSRAIWLWKTAAVAEQPWRSTKSTSTLVLSYHCRFLWYFFWSSKCKVLK